MRVYQLSPAKYALQNLRRSRLKVSTFEDLNDPFELLSARLPEPSLRTALREFKTDAHGSMGILCFGPSWENPVMWSHYADKHRGMCLGFDIPDEYAIRVKYIAHRTAVRFLDGVQTRGVDPRYALDLMRSKYKAWGYENEVRMFVGLDEAVEDSGMYFYPFGPELTLREVILGPRCVVPNSEVSAALESAAASTRVIKARLAFNSFRVVTDRRSVT
jgi:hypothetical protein